MRPSVRLIGLPEDVARWLAEAVPEIDVATASIDALAAPQAGTSRSVLIVTSDPEIEALSDALAGGDLDLEGSRPTIIAIVDPGRHPNRARDAVHKFGVDILHLSPLDRAELARQIRSALDIPEAETAKVAAVDQGMKLLWEKFRESVVARIAAIEEAGIALLEGNLSADLRRQAEREAHKLVGSSGTFGFASASTIARQIENILGGDEKLQQSDILQLTELTVRLRDAFDGDPLPDTDDEPDEPATTLLVLTSDKSLSRSLRSAAGGRSIRAIVLEKAGEVRTRLLGQRPDVALIDLEPGSGTATSLTLLQLLSGAEPPIPVIILAGDDSVTPRVEAARLGARAYLPRDTDPKIVVDEVARLVERLAPPRSSILAVDDDPELLSGLKRMLESNGYLVTAVDDPLKVPEIVEHSSPDLLIADVDMPQLSGIELCRLIRNDPRWEALPVLIMTSNRAPDLVQRVFAAGADDFVLKPLVIEELVSRIGSRLERVRLYRSLAERDYLTGLPNRVKTLALFDQLRSLTVRQNQPLSVALIDIDHFKEINDEHGHPAGDRVLRHVANIFASVFRGEDVVGRWGGDEFVVLNYGLSRSACVERLREVQSKLKRTECLLDDGTPVAPTFSAGVAEHGPDGEKFDELLGAADVALYDAKTTGRGALRATGVEPDEGTDRLDVLVVEDDEALGQLLVDALVGRGYDTLWVPDGYDALTWLDPGQGGNATRVLLLDVDLPGMDGLTLLRHLKLLGVTNTTRVLMLTARANEKEVVEALEAGAFDHVAKPFSIPVLMMRVEKALGR